MKRKLTDYVNKLGVINEQKNLIQDEKYSENYCLNYYNFFFEL